MSQNSLWLAALPSKNKKKPRRRNIYIFSVPLSIIITFTQIRNSFTLHQIIIVGMEIVIRPALLLYPITQPKPFFWFLLLLISTHIMRRLVLVVNDVNLFTGIRHQH